MSQRPVIRIQAVVEPGGRISIQDDRLPAGTAVELLVLLPPGVRPAAGDDPVFYCAADEEAYRSRQEEDDG